MGITLGKKQLNKGRVSLYLNYSYNGKRRKEYLGIILDAPTSAERRAENRNKVLIARQIRAKKELEFLSVEYHLNDIENTFDDILPTDTNKEIFCKRNEDKDPHSGQTGDRKSVV